MYSAYSIFNVYKIQFHKLLKHIILHTIDTYSISIKSVLSFLVFSDVGILPPAFLQASLADWMSTENLRTTCGATFVGPLVHGSQHFFGTVLAQCPTTGQIV